MSTPAEAHFVADCGGQIEAMAMTIPCQMLHRDDGKARAFAKLIQALPSPIQLFLMTDDPAAPLFQRWIEEMDAACRLTIVGAGPDEPLMESEMWSQDPFMVANHAGNLHLYRLKFTDRPGRQADWLSSALPAPMSDLPLHLTGGNTLMGPDFRIVGAQSVEQTRYVGVNPLSFDDALACHRASDPRPLHVFGFALPAQAGTATELRQQPHHVDLVLSVTGLRSRDGRPLLVLADPRAGPDPDGPRVPGWAEQLDASANRLLADGFAVVRNPVPYLAHPQFSPNPSLRPFNNVFLENNARTNCGKARPLAWLPQFSDLEPELAEFDRRNRLIWEEIEFEIVPVFGWSALARAGGGPRCASKVLRRAVFPPSAPSSQQ